MKFKFGLSPGPYSLTGTLLIFNAYAFFFNQRPGNNNQRLFSAVVL